MDQHERFNRRMKEVSSWVFDIGITSIALAILFHVVGPIFIDIYVAIATYFGSK